MNNMVNTDKIKVSVIVPVYNSSKYLKKCLESLVNQTLKNIEIIIVDDASNDNSLEIAKEYNSKYLEKIKIIELQERKGPGGARNAGLLQAEGEYIGFVDSDDDVKCSMYEILYKTALKGEYDIVDCAFYNEFADQNMRTIGNNAIGKLSIAKKKDLMMHAGFIWSKIIKREIIINNNICFRENVIYEDIDFIRLIILNSSRIYAVSKVLYNYRNNHKSVTNSKDILFQIDSKMKSMTALVDKFKEINSFQIYKEEFEYLIYKTYINIIDIALSDNKVSLDNNIYSKVNKFFFTICDKDYVNNKYIKKMPKEQRFFADLNNFDNKAFMKYINDIH